MLQKKTYFCKDFFNGLKDLLYQHIKDYKIYIRDFKKAKFTCKECKHYNRIDNCYFVDDFKKRNIDGSSLPCCEFNYYKE